MGAAFFAQRVHPRCQRCFIFSYISSLPPSALCIFAGRCHLPTAPLFFYRVPRSSASFSYKYSTVAHLAFA